MRKVLFEPRYSFVTLILFSWFTSMITVFVLMPPVAYAQQGVPPTPSPLDQTADQLQAQADAAIARAQAAVAAAQSAANAAAQAKVAAAEARQRANALEAQAATSKAFEAEQRANEAVASAQLAVSQAGEALRLSAQAVTSFKATSASAATKQAEYILALSLKQSALNSVMTHADYLSIRLGETETNLLAQSNRVTDLKSALVWVGMLGIVVCLLAMRLARRAAPLMSVPLVSSSGVTLDNDTGEAAPEARVVDLDPAMRRHIDRLLSA